MTRRRGQGPGDARGRLLGVLLAALLAALLASPAAAEAEESFKKGMAAAELGRTSEAVDWLRRAIVEDPEESERRVLISGLFSHPYLPHYYLGRALVEGGEGRCFEALAAFAESSRQGVVKRFARQAEDLEKSRERCTRLVLPARLELAEKAVEDADLAAAPLGEVLEDSALETERLAALAQLQTARGSLVRARAEGSVSRAETARELAEDAGSRLREVAERSVAGRRRQLVDAAARARLALTEARRAERGARDALSRPRLVAAIEERPSRFAGLELPATLADTLGALQGRLDGASDLATYRQVEADASALARALEELRGRAAAAFDALVESPPTVVTAAADLATGSLDTASLEVASRGSRPPSSPQPREPTAASVEERPDPAPPAQLQNLLGLAETLLGRVDPTPGGGLLATLHARLEARAAAARGDALPAAEVEARLAAAYTALQVVAGADALFTGRAVDAVEILSSRALPASRLGAQGLLLRAAALGALSRLDESRQGVLQRRADRDLRRSRALDADLLPEPRAFPSFYREWFARAQEPADGD